MLDVEPRTASSMTPWYREASRWTQLTFVEDDPLTFDLDAWRGVMRDTQSNAICVSAGGYIAYYPSAIPFHYRSRHLGDRDLLGEVVDTARSLGMKVMVRVDPHAVHADAAAAHPEWLALDRDGQPVGHASFPDIWITCSLTTYHSEFITEVSRELVREYDIDAIFANRWEGPAKMSYSEAARRGFRDACGLELPERQHHSDPNWPAYAAWRSERLGALVETWDRAVRDVKPSARFVPNRGMWQTRAVDQDTATRLIPAFYIDKQGRSGDESIWSAGRVGKRLKGLFPEHPVNIITSVGPEQHEHRWKDSVDAPDELITSIVNGFLHEADPWFTKFNARIVDDRWIAPVAHAFGLHALVEPTYRQTVAAPEVCILDSVSIDDADVFASYTARFPDEDGFYHALVEARIPFGYVCDRGLTLERLRGVRVLVLPNTDALTADVSEVLRRYVSAGGSIIAAHTSSLADDDFLLADVFGVHATGAVRTGVKNNYIALTADHPATAGYDGTSRIIGGTAIVPVDVDSGIDVDVPFRFIPDFPDLPMEEVYPREGPRDPAVVCRTTPSGGRVGYVAFNLGAIFWETLQRDHLQLVGNLVRWALGGPPRVEVTGDGLVDIAVRAAERLIVVAIANIENAMSMRGQVHRLRPLGPQTISLARPDRAGAVRARCLVSGADLPVQVVDARINVTIPEIAYLELVRFEWSQPDSRTDP